MPIILQQSTVQTMSMRNVDLFKSLVGGVAWFVFDNNSFMFRLNKKTPNSTVVVTDYS